MSLEVGVFSKTFSTDPIRLVFVYMENLTQSKQVEVFLNGL